MAVRDALTYINNALETLFAQRWQALCHGWYEHAALMDAYISGWVLMRACIERVYPNRLLPVPTLENPND